jgi:hypothetical protein
MASLLAILPRHNSPLSLRSLEAPAKPQMLRDRAAMIWSDRTRCSNTSCNSGRITTT